jgi:hypothetical protein
MTKILSRGKFICPCCDSGNTIETFGTCGTVYGTTGFGFNIYKIKCLECGHYENSLGFSNITLETLIKELHFHQYENAVFIQKS